MQHCNSHFSQDREHKALSWIISSVTTKGKGRERPFTGKCNLMESIYLKIFHPHCNSVESRFHFSIVQIRRLKRLICPRSQSVVSELGFYRDTQLYLHIDFIYTLCSSPKLTLFFYLPQCFSYYGLHITIGAIASEFYFTCNRCAKEMALINRWQILFMIKTLHHILFPLGEAFVHFMLFIILQSWLGQYRNFGNSVKWLAGCLSNLNLNYRWNLPREHFL